MKTEEQRLLDELYDSETRRVKREDYLFDRVSKTKPPSLPANYPDAKKHQIVSFIKSGFRITACFVGGIGFYEYGFFILGLAEVVGIIEELV